MKQIILLTLVLLAIVACSAEPETIEVEVTRVVEKPVTEKVEITRLVEETLEVEVTRLVEVEVTREVEVTQEVEVTRVIERVVTPTDEPTAAAQPAIAPASSSEETPVDEQPEASTFVDEMTATRQMMFNYGGQIDAALRGDGVYCDQIVGIYATISMTPARDISAWTADEQNAYAIYQASISTFLEGTWDMTNSCHDFLSGASDRGIPFQQWGLARQKVNEAVDIMHQAFVKVGVES